MTTAPAKVLQRHRARRSKATGLLYHGTVLEDYKPMALGSPATPSLARFQMIEDAKRRRYGYVPQVGA